MSRLRSRDQWFSTAALSLTFVWCVDMAFEWDQPYDASGKEPQQIRDDFSEMICANDDKNHPGIEGRILDGLADWLPSSVLAEFMDDLAMGRV